LVHRRCTDRSGPFCDGFLFTCKWAADRQIRNPLAWPGALPAAQFIGPTVARRTTGHTVALLYWHLKLRQQPGLTGIRM